jgi:hypothetical protein
VTQYLQEFRYLGPIREVPSRNHRPQRSSDRFSGIHRQRWPSGIGAWDALYNEREELVADTSDWLASPDKLDAGVELVWKSYKELDLSDPLIVKLQSGRAFDDVEGAQLNLERLATGSRLCIMPLNSEIELQPNDVGVGIAQVLPVLVSALDDVDSFTAIEQPELHLHPRLQARLADVFLVSSHTSIHGFLLETHSEHLLLRIQRRIRECSQGKRELDLHIGRGSVAIYYVCQQEGQTKLLRMNLDDQGDFIEPWPDDFFEIDFFERFPDAR